jgi:hypothetical protein
MIDLHFFNLVKKLLRSYSSLYCDSSHSSSSVFSMALSPLPLAGMPPPSTAAAAAASSDRGPAEACKQEGSSEQFDPKTKRREQSNSQIHMPLFEVEGDQERHQRQKGRWLYVEASSKSEKPDDHFASGNTTNASAKPSLSVKAFGRHIGLDIACTKHGALMPNPAKKRPRWQRIHISEQSVRRC